MVENSEGKCSANNHGVNCSCPHPLMGLVVAVLAVAALWLLYMAVF